MLIAKKGKIVITHYFYKCGNAILMVLVTVTVITRRGRERRVGESE